MSAPSLAAIRRVVPNHPAKLFRLLSERSASWHVVQPELNAACPEATRAGSRAGFFSAALPFPASPLPDAPLLDSPSCLREAACTEGAAVGSEESRPAHSLRSL